MDSELLEELPVNKYPNARLKQYQKKYKETVEIVKNLYSDTVVIVDENEDVKMMPGTQGLRKVTPILIDESYCIKLNNKANLISAFYVPEDIKFIILSANGNTLEQYCGNFKAPKLEEMLLESKTLPANCEQSQLEYILWTIDKKKTGFNHNRAKYITIDDQVYRRLVFIQPVLPCLSCYYCDLELFVSDKRPIYLEYLYTDFSTFDYFKTEDLVLWLGIENTDCPLIKCIDGSMVNIYVDQNSDDEFT